MTLKSVKFITLILASIIGIGALSFTPVFAIDDVCNSKAIHAVKEAAGCYDSSANELPNLITDILKGIIAIAGLIAVIFIIVGGVSYMTSAGDPGKVKKAKDTILYALIGLIVCALAFVIVNFVITKIL